MAEATERPSPRAGPMQPKPVVMPAVAMDTIATMVALSIGSPSYHLSTKHDSALAGPQLQAWVWIHV